jgi:branched-chain amino acid transport system ATP-binding protein
MNAPILTTQNLGLDIGGATIVAGVSLEVKAGEFLGIIGPNGAGKTSLFNLLSGLLRPTSGTVTLGGRTVTHAPAHLRAQAGLGRTFQLSSVFPRLSAFENVRLAAEASIGGTLRVWRRASGVREAVERANDALERVRLGGHKRFAAASLSGGDKRKLEVAMLLASDPAVFLLDEPMAGVSAEDVPGLVEVIGDVHRGGKTVLMVEHHIEVVTGLAERIAVMHHGSLLACDTPENVMRDATVQQAYVGEPL